MELFVFVAVLTLISATVVLSALRRRRFAPVLAVLGVTYVRIVPHLGPDVQWHHDSYFYFLATRGLFETHHLTAPPHIQTAYSLSSQKLQYFVLPVLTTAVKEVGGIESLPLLRLGVPVLFGPVLFLVVWALYRRYLPAEWALVGAFVYAMLDAAIGHHLIYHQQAMGTLVLVFLLFAVMNAPDVTRYRYVLLPFILILPFTHNATPLFAVVVIGVPWIVVRLAPFVSRFDRPTPLSRSTARNVTRAYLSYLVVLLGTLAFVTSEYFLPLIGAAAGKGAVVVATAGSGDLSLLMDLFSSSSQDTLSNYRVPRRPTVLDSTPLVTKVVFVALAAPAVVLARHRQHVRIRGPLVFATGAVLALVGGYVVIGGAVVGRITESGYVLAVLVAFYTISVLDGDTRHRVGRAVVVSLFVVLVVANSVVIVVPSLVDHDADINGDGYHQIEPIQQQLPEAGYWIRETAPRERTFYSVYKPRAVVYYYGLRHVRYLQYATGTGYVVNDEARLPDLVPRADRHYTNGRITISYGNASEINPRVDRTSAGRNASLAG